MSDEAEGEGIREKPFHVDRAKSARAGCKKCKEKINNGELRIGKLAMNPFGSGTMKLWHHVKCLQEVFKKQRKTTKKIENSDDIGGWDALSKEDKDTIKQSLGWYLTPEELDNFEVSAVEVAVTDVKGGTDTKRNDDSFRAFRKLCSELTNESSYNGKTAKIKTFFTKGSDGNGFKGDIQLWCRSLLPMAAKRIYNLQSKQLIKIFSELFRESQEQMLEDLERGDVAETIGSFFEANSRITPAKKAVLTLHEVDEFLEYLSKLTREADQKSHFEKILVKCTSNDLKVVIRLIKHDLRINAGPKHVLEALHEDAYQAFQASRDLEAVVRNATSSTVASTSSNDKGMSIGIKLMTPVRPMLAEACKSVEMALKKCPKGMYSEIKYDGERVQLHKKGDEFKFFSRSLKAVIPHKVKHFHKYIPLAFPHGKDLILDSEILMMDTTTGQPLPFGTLGKHKKTEFKDATVCLFVFDCMYFNGQSLVDEPIKYRRKVLRENMTEIPNHVMFSEMKEIHDKEDLEGMIEEVLRKGLEGLVLKPLHSIYEPGKRHWLKVKKDYLFGGSMADSADLVVLGAWYGTGKKGGIMSVFLMGCLDEKRNSWVTVTKVHGGHDDKTLESLQKELKMVKISQNVAKVPSWLRCNKTMVPDFVAEDPKESQVWEITGAEFTCNQVHTAEGISIRFPRVTRIRSDKNWETATSLQELKKLYAASKDTSGFTLKGRNAPNSIKTTLGTTKKPVKKKKDEFIDDSDVETEVDSNSHEDLEDEESPAKKKDGKKKRKKASRKRGHESKTDTDNDSDGETPTKEKRNKEPKKKRAKMPKGKGIQYETDTEDDSKERKISKESKKKVPKQGSDDETEIDSDEGAKRGIKKVREDKKELSQKDERTVQKKKRNPWADDSSSESEFDQNDIPETSRTTRRATQDNDTDRRKGTKERSSNTATPSKKVKLDEESTLENSKERVAVSDRKRVREKHSREEESPQRKKNASPPQSKNKSSSMKDSGSETEVDEEPVRNASEKFGMANELPTLFKDAVLFLHRKVPEFDKVRRYVIAYGGSIYSEEKNTCLENNKIKVTHIVYPSKVVEKKVKLKNEVDKIRSVSVKWVWDTINMRRKLDENKYRVKES